MSSEQEHAAFEAALSRQSDGTYLIPGWDVRRVRAALAAAPATPKILLDGSTLYELNSAGTNRWSANVQPGHEDDGSRTSAEACRAIAESMAAAPVQAVPHPGSPEASAMIDSELAARGWPSNAKNAARAGYEACRKLAAAPAAPQVPICQACKGSGEGGSYRVSGTESDFVDGPCHSCGGSGEEAPQAPAVPKDDLTTRLSRKAEALRDAHPGESAALDVAGLLDEAVSALSAPQVPAVPQRDDADRLLREVFALCEATEDAPEVNAKNEHQKGFDRGRRFEAKQIRRAVGAWFQDEFCGRSFMGEPIHWMPLPAAPGAPQPAERVPLTDAQIEAGRRETFSTENPFCPCDSKTMRKAVRWAEHAHGIRAAGVKEPT